MPTQQRNFLGPIDSRADNHNDFSNLSAPPSPASFGPRNRKRMSYEYDPISRPYPVCSTSMLEKESSLMSFEDSGLLHFLRNPLFDPSSVSRSVNGIHPLPSSCQDLSETSSDEEEEVKDLLRKTEITTTKRSRRPSTTIERSLWPGTTTKRPTRQPEFKHKAQHQLPRNHFPFFCHNNSSVNLSSEEVTEKATQGTRTEIERGGRRRRKRLPRLTPRASHLLQVLSVLCFGQTSFYRRALVSIPPFPSNPNHNIN